MPHIAHGLDRSEKLARFFEGNLARRVAPAADRCARRGETREDRLTPESRDQTMQEYINSFRDVEHSPMTLPDMAREYMISVLNMREARQMSREQISRAIFSQQVAMRSAAANSSASISNILSNVQNKVMLKAYRRRDRTWEPWCKLGNLPDFKVGTRKLMSDTADLKETGENGEIFDSQVTDQKENIQLALFARKASFTWQAMMNDDLDALATIGMRQGQAAARLPARLVYTSLLANPTLQDGVTLFHASHGNLDSTVSAFQESTLKTALNDFRKQKSIQAPNDTEFTAEPIDIDPAYILCPPELEIAVKRLVNPNLYVETAVFASMFKPIIEPRLSTTGYTGQSATAWYLMADAGDIDNFEVAFLEGDDNPRFDTFEDFNVLAVQFRTYLPCGVKPLDFRGMHKSVGA